MMMMMMMVASPAHQTHRDPLWWPIPSIVCVFDESWARSTECDVARRSSLVSSSLRRWRRRRRKIDRNKKRGRSLRLCGLWRPSRRRSFYGQNATASHAPLHTRTNSHTQTHRSWFTCPKASPGTSHSVSNSSFFSFFQRRKIKIPGQSTTVLFVDVDTFH